LCLRDLDALPGPAMGRQALTALGMGTGLTHLEWFHTPTARIDLLPIGAPRRDWRQTFLSDGNLVVRHPDRDACQAMAEEAAAAIHLYAE
ncbi:MAG: hypothetical protein AAF602_22660, partial [Myxococcota bacterium]